MQTSSTLGSDGGVQYCLALTFVNLYVSACVRAPRCLKLRTPGIDSHNKEIRPIGHNRMTCFEALRPSSLSFLPLAP